MEAIENRFFDHYRINQEKIDKAIKFLEENGYKVEKQDDEK